MQQHVVDNNAQKKQHCEENSGMIQQLLAASDERDEDGQPRLTMDNVQAITRDMVIAGKWY
jgi:hypothetical protein